MDELRASQERYRALVELSPDGIAVIQKNRLVFANQQALRLIGVKSIEELADIPAADLVPPAVREPLTKRYRALTLGARVPYVEGTLVRVDGTSVPIEVASATIEYEDRQAVMVVVRDISGRRDSEQATWAAEQRFSAAFHEAPIAMLLVDPLGVVLDANPALGELVGDDPRALVTRQSLRLVHPDDRPAVRTMLRSATEDGEPIPPLEWRLVRTSGEQLWVQASIARLPGEPKALVVHLIDVTERRANEARLAHRALHDPLTGLPNRTLLTDRLEQAVLAAGREQRGGVTVLYLDLDDFKAINDTYGHATGDQVLIEVARRLRAAVRPSDTVARLGGDEYAVVAENLPAADARALVDRLQEALQPPIENLPAVASIGLAHSSEVGLDASALLRRADADMYRIKARHRRQPPPDAA